ncbi:hypothetical protein SODALDRAFT_353988 [Sodiomyces alkalinus F11]|uniref:Uncharacterized protein n=1 Tax=Sodiomyces alkalinus (strain CBS 110278 / VKM F-3762 / F11) TaxID=1314773 RepID=A0A3N2Q593_SODAK|nr:hypothetical protein SODALDRAFT_353988 [Sodiomyces alkalinus F11]ROT41867.1 hypothetical protein SODALDRAFT_353988 [Sodiomyces alkalinus F11]
MKYQNVTLLLFLLSATEILVIHRWDRRKLLEVKLPQRRHYDRDHVLAPLNTVNTRLYLPRNIYILRATGNPPHIDMAKLSKINSFTLQIHTQINHSTVPYYASSRPCSLYSSSQIQ